MSLEHLDRRVLGAVRFIDATTGVPVENTLQVRSEQVSWMRNRRGYYVMSRYSGSDPDLQTHHQEFANQPAAPPVGTDIAVSLEVEDPAGQYLPRQGQLLLPRDADPANVGNANSLFRLIDSNLFLAPTAPTAPGWAVVRARVTNAGNDEPLPGALIRVLRTSDALVLARGLSDWRGRIRGEALVAVPGIPVTTWAEEEAEEEPQEGEPSPVVVHEVPVTVEVVVDPQFDPDAGMLPDPDDLEARRNELPSASFALELASGETLTSTFAVPIP